MANESGIEVKGLPELVGNCRQMEKALVGETVKSNVAAGEVVSRTAKGLTPHRTGRLAGSIRVVERGLEARVETSLSYARFVHFGSIHNPRPVPFLYDALDRRHDAVIAVYDTRIGALTERVF